MLKDSLPNIYELTTPDNPLPLIFDSPHSGTHYPADFDYACDFEILETMIDRHVDDLYAAAPQYGIPFLTASFVRSYLDLNRPLSDIDPLLLDGEWPEDIKPSPRTKMGAGLIWRMAKADLPIYSAPLPVKDVKHRIDRYYMPYYQKLGALLDEAYRHYDGVWHINCHSMPSGKLGQTNAGAVFSAHMADFVLGDINGTSCSQEFLALVRDTLKEMGYNVAVNNPYAGCELTRHFSDIRLNRHSLQIEINRALYMDEKTHEKSKNYNRLKEDLESLIQKLAAFVRAQTISLADD